MSCGLETADYWGTLVICTHEIWDGHIISKHYPMENLQAAVQISLSNPKFVYQSGRYPDRKLFYRPYLLPRPYDTHYLLVVVGYYSNGTKTGTVITAYPRKFIAKGDILIWPKP